MEALVGSLDDTLSDKVVLEEVDALKRSGKPFQEVFADVQRGRKVGSAAGAASTLAEEQRLKAVPTLRGLREIQDHMPAAN